LNVQYLDIGGDGGEGTFIVQGATVSISNVTNAGTISLVDPPSQPIVGDLDVSTSFSQSSTGTLDIEIDGANAGAYGVLDVTGSLSLAGQLNIYLGAGFVPSYGQVFDIIDANSVTGTFSDINLPDGDQLFCLSYTPNGVVLTAIPEPATLALLTPVSLLLLGRRTRIPG
jgi:hypothetical protein